ncbi:MAG: PAS domain S-box protein [Deltaproteobacteria bacterium]|nr:PAS domain S-box protein [Candidatus Zymogenaceae bacterium]
MNRREDSKELLLSEIGKLEDDLSRAKDEVARLLKINDTLIDVMPDPADIVNETYDIVFQNKASVRMFGKAERRKCYAFYHGKDSPCSWCTAIKSIREHRRFNREVCLDNGIVLKIHSVPIPMPDGSTASLEIARDISDDRKIQVRAREQTKKLEILNHIILAANRADNIKSLLDNLLTMILDLMDFAGGAIYLVDESSDVAEIAVSRGLPEEFVDRIRTINTLESPFDIVFKNNVMFTANDYQKSNPVLARLANIESFASIPLFSRGKAIGALNVVRTKKMSFTEETEDILSSVGREIGTAVARMRAEEELKEREETWRSLFENSIEAVFTVSLEGNIMAANSALIKMSGYTDKEVIGASYIKFCSPDKAEEIYRNYNSLYKTGVPIENFSYSMYTKDGTERKVEGYVTVLKHRGKTIGFQGTLRDITQRLMAEQALAEEKERLAVTLKSIGDGVITTDIEGKIVLINRVAESLTGFSQQEAQGKRLLEVFRIINEKTRLPCEDPVKKVIDSAGMIEIESDTILITKDGTERIVADSGSPIKDKDSNIIGVVLVFRDVTEKKRIEDELRKTQKLESLGILAGGIAHDYNNILTAIIANISLTKTYSQKGDRIYDRLEKMEKAAIMAGRLNHQLLTFSRGGVPVKETLIVSELVRDSVTFALGGSNVRCEFKIDDDLRPVDADVGQLSQVFNNIVINAQQAMPDGGTLTVNACNVTISDDDTLPILNGQYVVISIADEGHGIPPENVEKIFDPFFTTKEKGSGLGLSISYSIVKNHDGYIEVRSKVGIGTTFLIYLPFSGAGDVLKNRTLLTKHPGGRGNILVMDDEEAIRDVAHTMLVGLGYEVDTARDGQEAVDKFKRAIGIKRPFDLVIMDLTIKGGMGGVQALGCLREIEPSVRAVVSSGYSNDPIMADFRAHGFVGVLIKPYRIGNLAEVLNTILKKTV